MSAEAYEDAIDQEQTARLDAAEALAENDPSAIRYVEKWIDANEYLQNHPNKLDYEFEEVLFQQGWDAYNESN